MTIANHFNWMVAVSLFILHLAGLTGCQSQQSGETQISQNDAAYSWLRDGVYVNVAECYADKPVVEVLLVYEGKYRAIKREVNDQYRAPFTEQHGRYILTELPNTHHHINMKGYGKTPGKPFTYLIIQSKATDGRSIYAAYPPPFLTSADNGEFLFESDQLVFQDVHDLQDLMDLPIEALASRFSSESGK